MGLKGRDTFLIGLSGPIWRRENQLNNESDLRKSLAETFFSKTLKPKLIWPMQPPVSTLRYAARGAQQQVEPSIFYCLVPKWPAKWPTMRPTRLRNARPRVAFRNQQACYRSSAYPEAAPGQLMSSSRTRTLTSHLLLLFTPIRCSQIYLSAKFTEYLQCNIF